VNTLIDDDALLVAVSTSKQIGKLVNKFSLQLLQFSVFFASNYGFLRGVVSASIVEVLISLQILMSL